MLKRCESAKKRWGGVSELIDSWLNERQTMLVLYCSLTGVDPQEDDDRPLQDKLRHFCQLLVDYVSAGHFEIYEQLEKAAMESGSDEILAQSQRLFQGLRRNTNICLDFNDNCESLGNIAKLQEMLSTIGEALEERFAMEDQLIGLLHHHHDKELNRIATG